MGGPDSAVTGPKKRPFCETRPISRSSRPGERRLANLTFVLLAAFCLFYLNYHFALRAATFHVGQRLVGLGKGKHLIYHGFDDAGFHQLGNFG